MPNFSYKRSDRVAQLLQREIGNVLQFEVQDPRLSFVTVTGVRVADDLKDATVFVTVPGEGGLKEKERALRSLERAVSHIRTGLARRCYLKFVPRLIFRLDNTLANASRIEQIIADLHLGESPGPEEERGGDEAEREE